MSAVMFIASLLGLNIGKEDKNMIDYNFNKTAVSVSISENPSTGYRWTYKIADEKKVCLSGDKYSYNAPADIVGAAGVRTFTFKGVSQGKTNVVLTYGRDWEIAPARVIVISITVGEDLKLEALLVSDTAENFDR